MKQSRALLGCLVAWITAIATVQAEILIHEIMYRPATGEPREQFVELHNTSTLPVDLHGWRLSGAIDYSFPLTTLPANGFLVVVASSPHFIARHPGVTNWIGDWTGLLDSRGTLRLRDANDVTQAAVSYDSEGDWSLRRLALDRGFQSWEWIALHDGGGSSLELVNQLKPATVGQNWDASTSTNGTPGRPNSIARLNSAPLILNVAHRPIIPHPNDPVTVVVRLVDEPGSPRPSATLFWRMDTTPPSPFTAVAMSDDGTQGDGGADDGSYGAVIPPQPLETIVEYYVTASDAQGNSRTYPRSQPEGNRTANLIYQVDDTEYSTHSPVYRVVMTAVERQALDDVNTFAPLSDAHSSGAFVVQDASGVTVRQQVGFRNRGHGSRSRTPHNIKVALPGDRPWKGHAGINLNSAFPYVQVAGSAIMREIGLIMAESQLVTVLVNGVNRARNLQYGYYAANWETDSDLIQSQVPLNTGGNIYRGIRNRDFGPGTANLVWRGDDYRTYTDAYFKANHLIENDWRDLLDLIAVLNSTNGYASSNYIVDVHRRLDVRRWMRYFASQTILDNRETNLSTGYGDDYSLYSGGQDARFQVLPYDLDSIMAQGDSGGGVSDDLFRMAIPGVGNTVAAVDRLIKTPAFVRIYYEELLQLCRGPFANAAMSERLERLFRNTTVPGTAVASMTNFNAARTAYILGAIPTKLSININLPSKGGFLYSTNPTVRMTGRADAARTHGVRVAGRPAAWTAWQAQWTAEAIPLQPGINRIRVTAVGNDDVELERQVLEVWYDDHTVTASPNVIATDTVWTAAEGPYEINSTLTVNSGATLTVEPGTTVYLGNNANFVIANGGRVLAVGTADLPIYWGRSPGGTGWGGITLQGGPNSPESRWHHVHFEGNTTTCIEVADGTLWLDHATFGNPGRPYLSLDRASFRVTDCTFPAATAPFELVHGTGGIKAGGHGLIQRCFFGTTIGYNDAVDFTGGNRDLSQPIIQFFHNVFQGSTDDLLDLDGTDAWIEGNIFLHCHANGSPDSASAISGGNDGNRTSEITAFGNLFYDCDQAATAKEGNFFTLLNNTIVRITREGGLDVDAGVVNVRDFPLSGSPTAFGRGFYLEGNVITDAAQLVRHHDPAQTRVTFNQNLLPQPWGGAGSGNLVATNAQLKHLPTLAETQFKSWSEAQVLWDWFRLEPTSPGRLAGGDGLDLGALRPGGARLTGVPVGTTRETNANIHVGPNRGTADGIPAVGWPAGAGFTRYRWRLDAGAWNDSQPVENPIILKDLAPGDHRVEVAGQRDTGLFQDDPLLGLDAVTTLSSIWTVDPTTPLIEPLQRLQLNEILADNQSVALVPGFFPDFIELYNPTDAEIDLSGVGLGTSLGNPFRYRFPPGSRIAPRGFLILVAERNPPAGVNQVAVGFGLSRMGDSLFLHTPQTNLIDAVHFGAQLPDQSIGRVTAGAWTLNQPTPGSPNIPVPLGDPFALRINEWLAAHQGAAAADYVELYNPDARPVNAGGLYLANAPASPAQHQLSPLHFIEGGGWAVLFADGNASDPNHLNFTLNPEAGFIGLSAPDLTPIDRLVYGPQFEDTSEGRSPDGSPQIRFLPSLSPGAGNSSTGPITTAITNITEVTVPLLSITNTWHYWQSGELAARWREPAYDDSEWPSGPALLYAETANLTAPKNTPLILGSSTYYFRTHFNVSSNPPGLRLLLHPLIDDGAVFWLNGQPLHRLGMDAADITFATFANRSVGDATYEGPFYLPTTDLQPGDNVLAVEVHQSGANSSDIVFGTALAAVFSVTNIIAAPTNTPVLPVVLNELVADNRSVLEPDGSAPDWIELYNPNAEPADLGGQSLTDDLPAGRKFTFATGTVLLAKSHLRLHCDGSKPASATNTGFSLNRSGGYLYLVNPAQAGGAVADSITYGLQVRDLSLARVPDGAPGWVPARPTPAAPNEPVALGSAEAVKINEWLADNSTGDDWLELYNPGSAPVILDGYHLSDDPSQPLTYTFPSHSFLGTGRGAWVRLQATGELRPPDASSLNFRLSRKADEITFSDPAGNQLDAIVIKDQPADISEGRVPDGSGLVIRFPTLPSPGAHNTPDADRDGMADDWEILHQLNPADAADAGRDDDGDALSNRDEFLAGTDPRDAASHLRLAIERPSLNTLRLRFTVPAEHRYVLQVSEVLTGAWQTLIDTGNRAIHRTVELPEMDASGAVQRYYRLTVRP